MPSSLRTKLILMMIIVVSIPIVSTGYVLEVKGREALLEEKTAKLFGLASILDDHLGDGFDTLLTSYQGDPLDRQAKILFLNKLLSGFTDVIAKANPGVGVGYYSKSLNAAITYGPSGEYGGKVGETLPPDHPGWKVMETGQRNVESGAMARGHIMNAMWPIIRQEKVIGYIWANEFTAAIDRQARSMDNALFIVTSLGLIFGLGLSFTVAGQLAKDVNTIKNGLHRMQHDLREPIKPLNGEMGDIAEAVNDMARSLLNARSLNENILWSIADGVITVDITGRVTSINPAAQRIISITPEEIIGQPYEGLFDVKENFTSLLLDTIRTGKEHVGVCIDVPFRGHMIYVSTSTSVLRDGVGRFIGAVAVFNDISETRRLQKQVIRADRLAALGELAAGIAHDIRNPLTSIRGFVQYLQKSGDPQEMKEYGPLIIREVDGLNRIIGQLLEFAKPHPPRFAMVQVNDLIHEMLLLIKNLTDKQDIHIDLHLEAKLPSTEADGEQLKQVLLNLLINSCQAIPEKGRIVISTSSVETGRLEISISDSGIGIAPENLEKIFDPFFSTKPAGTGLGLAVVQRIIHEHGGEIGIGSEIGKGTTVTIRLQEIHNMNEAL